MNTVRLSVTLIGMPATGKTRVGDNLAEILNLPFVDTDRLIIEHLKADRLEQVVDTITPEAFAAVEEAVGVLAAFATRQTIIATSGSMVYYERAMQFLQENTHVVYLEASLKTIKRRVARRPNRGIVFAPGETLAD